MTEVQSFVTATRLVYIVLPTALAFGAAIFPLPLISGLINSDSLFFGPQKRCKVCPPLDYFTYQCPNAC